MWSVTPRSLSSLTARTGEMTSWPYLSYTSTFQTGSEVEEFTSGAFRFRIFFMATEKEVINIKAGFNAHEKSEKSMARILAFSGKTRRCKPPSIFSSFKYGRDVKMFR